jgi:hypothetical protein
MKNSNFDYKQNAAVKLTLTLEEFINKYGRSNVVETTIA